jgi:hypothetical protein
VSEQRKATEVLVELETKIDNLVSLTKAQGLNFQIISNKLNEVMTALSKQTAGKITVEAVTKPQMPTSPLQNFQPTDPERQIPVFAEAKLPETNAPQGFRRSSRPETFAGQNQEEQEATAKFPVQIPKAGPPPGRRTADEAMVAPLPPMPAAKQAPSQKPTNKPVKATLVQNAIPVQQRIVNKTGNSIFLADVEVTDMASGQVVHKTRTAGNGKWMASLGIGAYRVVIRKRESVSKEALEAIQDVQVDGSRSPLELQTLIIK